MAENYFIKVLYNAYSGDPDLLGLANADFAYVDSWYLHDEPDWDGIGSATFEETNDVFWNNNAKHPTVADPIISRSFNEYGQIADIAATDHYSMFGAQTTISGTWSTRYSQMRETWEKAESLKENTEPKTMWTWSQLTSGDGIDPGAVPAGALGGELPVLGKRYVRQQRSALVCLLAQQ